MANASILDKVPSHSHTLKICEIKNRKVEPIMFNKLINVLPKLLPYLLALTFPTLGLLASFKLDPKENITADIIYYTYLFLFIIILTAPIIKRGSSNGKKITIYRAISESKSCPDEKQKNLLDEIEIKISIVVTLLLMTPLFWLIMSPISPFAETILDQSTGDTIILVLTILVMTVMVSLSVFLIIKSAPLIKNYFHQKFSTKTFFRKIIPFNILFLILIFLLYTTLH